MRITWFSNSPWVKSGYGGQTAQVIRRLKAAGHEVAVASNYGLAGMHTEWEGIRVMPQGKDRYSNDVSPGHHKLWAPDGWLITLYDVWGLEPDLWKDLRVASWTPVDHDPIPPAVAAWASNHLTMVWSRFAERLMTASGIKSYYVPLAIEPVFQPTALTSRGDSAREALGVAEDAFLVTINSANTGNHPPRKGWGEMFMAFSMFAAEHPEAVLYVHADRYGYLGIDLAILATACKISPDQLRWADQYALLNGLIDDRDLAAIYTASDVLLCTSYGEGFGIPVVEAQACGTPVIVSDWTAQPELVGAGWVVPVQPMWDASQASFYGMPMIGHIVAALDQAYRAKGDPEIAQLAITKAAEYGADKVFEENWKPVLAEMERLLPVNEPIPMNRAARRRRR